MIGPTVKWWLDRVLLAVSHMVKMPMTQTPNLSVISSRVKTDVNAIMN